jgi:hypothetical protein
MPAASEKQKKFMDAVAHNKGFAKKVGVPQSVGAEFSDKSKGMKFGSGSQTRVDRQEINKPKTDHGDKALFKQGGRIMATKMNPGFMAMMAKKKAGAKAPAKKMASGGMAASGMGKVPTAAPSRDGVASKGKTKGTQIVMAGNKGMKKGGMAKAKC